MKHTKVQIPMYVDNGTNVTKCNVTFNPWELLKIRNDFYVKNCKCTDVTKFAHGDNISLPLHTVEAGVPKTVLLENKKSIYLLHFDYNTFVENCLSVAEPYFLNANSYKLDEILKRYFGKTSEPTDIVAPLDNSKWLKNIVHKKDECYTEFKKEFLQALKHGEQIKCEKDEFLNVAKEYCERLEVNYLPADGILTRSIKDELVNAQELTSLGEARTKGTNYKIKTK